MKITKIVKLQSELESMSRPWNESDKNLSNLDTALKEQERSGRPRKLNGKAEAMLVATACSDAPGGRSEWTMQLLAQRLVELKIVEALSDETVRRVLKKTT